MLHQLILAGGSGTRFWPKSRAALPKQLLSLDGGPTLLEKTAARLEGIVAPERIFVVTTAQQAPLVRERLPQVPAENVIAEPMGRDTAAAIGLGAAAIARRDPDATIVSTHADQLIEPPSKLRAVVDTAARVLALRPEAVVLVGIRPDHAATGYGYIERGELLSESAALDPRDRAKLARLAHVPYRVRRFREKPDRVTAEAFVAQGGFFWNAGIFVWRAKALLGALERFLPATAAVVRLEGEALAAAWPGLTKVPIDIAVLEKHEEALVLEADFAWSDVGSWTALPPIHGADADGHTVLGATHVGVGSRGLIVVGDGRRVIATLGVEDLVIVDTPDALLVCRKDRVEDVKKITQELERSGRKEVL
jgi:mannose-1-phosphate guanylyltransferase